MLKWLMHKGIAAFERKWQYDASYLHEIIDVSPRAAWMFSRAAAIGTYRKDVPLAAWTAAAITAVRAEDCGPCTQLGVQMAEKSGVDPNVLRAILAEDAAAMPDDVALAWRFTRGLFVILLPLVLGLWVSTIYLRHHFVVDLLAGFALAPLAYVLAPKLDAWWAERRRSVLR